MKTATEQFTDEFNRGIDQELERIEPKAPKQKARSAVVAPRPVSHSPEPPNDGCPPLTEIPEQWQSPWREYNKNGKPLASFHNAKVGLVNMGITVKHDLFHDVTIIGHKDSDVVHDV